MSKQVIEYSPAPCGSGKTEWAVNLMANKLGLYIYAVDRIVEMDVRKKKSKLRPKADERRRP